MSSVVAPELGAPPLIRHAPPELVIAANPGAGALFTKPIDDGYWWRVLAIACRLTTDANAANRTLRVEYRGPDQVPFILAGAASTYPANTTAEDFSLSVWQPQTAAEVGAANLAPLPGVILQPGQDFRINVVNIQAGDTLTRIRYIVERFVAPSSDVYPSE